MHTGSMGPARSFKTVAQAAHITLRSTFGKEFVSKCEGSACQHFSYDVFGILRNVILDNGIQIEYVIDGRNRRIGKKINGTLVQGFIYDDQLRIVGELDGQNQVVATFIYADHINVPEIIEKGGKTYRILHDHLGSPRFVIDAQTGELAQELQYDAWGNVIYDSNPGFQPFGFAGGIYDTQTKLIRFGARDYDPQVGRWTAKDPAGLALSWFNMFSYSDTDPLNFSDPTGELAWSPLDDFFSWRFPSCPFIFFHYVRQRGSSSFGLSGGRWDAFRHCFWSCISAKACGVSAAFLAGWGHEVFQNRENFSWDDVFNNKEGRKCARLTCPCESCCRGKLACGELRVPGDQ